MRDVQTVVASEAEEEVVAGDARDLLRLEPEQLADAVILVDDEIAAAEIGERLQGATTDSPLARRPLAEDLCVGQQDEAEIAPDEAASSRRDGEHEAGLARQLLTFGDDARFDATEKILLPPRLAEVREGDYDTLPQRTNAESSFSASASPRATRAGLCASKANG